MTGRRFLFILVLVLTLLVLAVPLAAQEDGPARVGLRPDAPEYALHGPYWVGTMEFVVEPESERPLPLTVWYPALNVEGRAEETTYIYESFTSISGFTQPGRAIQDAVPDVTNGPYPLVIVSHGSVMWRYGYAYLAEHLASYGFVVMAIDHTGNTLAYGWDPEVMGANMEGWVTSLVTAPVYRPADIQRTIDFAGTLPGESRALNGAIDSELSAVVGHSLGAYTAEVAAGAQVNLSRSREWCEANAGNEEIMANLGYTMICQVLVPSEEQILALRGVTATSGELWPPFEITGVDAVVPISGPWFFAPDSFQHVTIPVMLVVGNKDYFPGLYDDVVMAYENLPGPQKGLITFENASHFFPLIPANDWLINHGGYMWFSEPVWDYDRAHDLINHFTTAFLLDVLKGDEAAHAALAPEAVAFPGITYEAEGF